MQEEQEQALSADSCLGESPYRKVTCVPASSPVGLDPGMASANEALLDSSSFHLWLQSQVEVLPHDALSSVQFEDLLPLSTEEECRQDSGVHQRPYSEQGPAQLRIEASVVIASDADVLGNVGSLASYPLPYALTEVGTEWAGASTATNKQH